MAHLISLGILDIKIAFTYTGIFHDKFGIMEDASGDIICFRGANNETDAALHKNYESFDITCSWQTSSFDYEKITKSQDTFDQLWNNRKQHIRVCELSQAIFQEIISHDRGRIVIDCAHLEPDCLLLDLDECLTLDIRINPDIFFNNSIYKISVVFVSVIA